MGIILTVSSIGPVILLVFIVLVLMALVCILSRGRAICALVPGLLGLLLGLPIYFIYYFLNK